MLMKHYATISEGLRFITLGIVNNILGYLLFLFFIFLGIEYKIAMSLLYFFGSIMSFVGNWKWVFHNNQLFFSAICQFFIVYLLGYLLNLALLIYFVDQLGYSVLLMQAIATVIVASFLFIMLKFIIFTYSTAR